MTLRDVGTRLNHIEAVARHPAAAHEASDELLAEVLIAIAAGATNPAELAAEALQVLDIDFPRSFG
ncbi:hypothetical protein G3T37_07225 [Galbitalea soli]|uniref:Uncharacterized protein n=2 Tax=Galbitalea soli TaxID=1268042 RepID=A0A7C9PMZ0_9MICO|nr:hypothetical protein [Galbitalea soli]